MLVLSRRPNETVVFPTLGVSIQVVRVQGQIVRLGIDAPKKIPVIRGELITGAVPPSAEAGPSLHTLRNALNKLSLQAYLVQRELELKHVGSAENRLNELLGAFQKLDREWSEKSESAPQSEIITTASHRALVVEDDANERELLAGLLSMHGCECDVAEDGLAAMDRLATRGNIDLVLLDMRMPRCDGAQTIQRIRNDPSLKDLKVFAISGTDQAEMGVGVGGQGVDAWFRKPLDPRKLWSAMQQHLTIGTN